MIISHEHKFIFLKPTKVAGSSVELFLSDLCGPDDVITPVYGIVFGDDDEIQRKRLGIRGPQNYREKLRNLGLHEWLLALEVRLGLRHPHAVRKLFRFSDHQIAETVRERVGARIFESYEIISILRDPFTFAVSRYNYDMAVRRKTPEELSFADFVMNNPQALVQNKKITAIDGRVIVDTWLRFDRLDEDLQRWLAGRGLQSRFRIGDIRLKDSRKLPHKVAFEDCYRGNQDAIDLISLLWKPEIAAHGFGIPSAT